MTLGVLLNIGESLAILKASGQDRRLIDYYLKKYTDKFGRVYLFSYAREKHLLPKNCVLIANQFKLHRFIYTFLMPIFHFREFKKCDILRVTHLLGSIPAIIAKIFYGKKFIVTYGYDYKNFSRLEGKSYLIPLIALIESLSFKLADGIIVTTKPIRDYVSHRVKKEKVFYIPNGVDVRLFKPKSTINNQQSTINKTILFVGRLEKQKNLFTLIKAVSSLRQKNILLKFVGEGGLKKKLIDFAKGKVVNLKIVSMVSYDKMPSVYQEADIFVLPSITEGHPKVLLEAMACGLVCIGNNIESINTIIEDKKNGLIFHNSAGSLSQVLQRVLNGLSRVSRLGLNARKFIVKNLDFEKLIKKEIKILKSL